MKGELKFRWGSLFVGLNPKQVTVTKLIICTETRSIYRRVTRTELLALWHSPSTFTLTCTSKARPDILSTKRTHCAWSEVLIYPSLEVLVERTFQTGKPPIFFFEKIKILQMKERQVSRPWKWWLIRYKIKIDLHEKRGRDNGTEINAELNKRGGNNVSQYQRKTTWQLSQNKLTRQKIEKPNGALMHRFQSNNINFYWQVRNFSQQVLHIQKNSLLSVQKKLMLLNKYWSTAHASTALSNYKILTN